ncbi:MAG: 30S ribosome-binding factor RbfA [Deltaproteobacteria bacterium]|nr:30S ribosome-binding factor RbfA [Deltaproteobacteria bacterium]
MEYKRSDRVGDLLLREVADLLLRRVKDPRVAGITITAVEVTADLQNARVYYCMSAAALQTDRKEVDKGLSKAKGFIRQELGRRLHMKHVPQIEFRYDTSFEYGDRIERLLKEVLRNEQNSE